MSFIRGDTYGALDVTKFDVAGGTERNLKIIV